MTRKDFNLIAETIRLLPSFETYQQDGKLYATDVVNHSTVCRRFAEALRQTNSRFDAGSVYRCLHWEATMTIYIEADTTTGRMP
jgi:hypothetical protein